MNKQELTPLFKATKEVVEFGEAIAKALADKKINVAEALGLLWESKDLIYIYNNWDSILSEFKNADAEKLEELNTFIGCEFDIDNNAAEIRIKEGIGVVTAITRFAKTF